MKPTNKRSPRQKGRSAMSLALERQEELEEIRRRNLIWQGCASNDEEVTCNPRFLGAYLRVFRNNGSGNEDA